MKKRIRYFSHTAWQIIIVCTIKYMLKIGFRKNKSKNTNAIQSSRRFYSKGN